MGDQFYKSQYINGDWKANIKMIIFDFDKTITRRHTGGAVTNPANATDEFIDKNFADKEFFKFVIPFIRAQQCEVGIASFGAANENAIISGIPLLRKYLASVFGEDKSIDLIPDDHIMLWHPEEPPSGEAQDPEKIGKQAHMQKLIDATGKKITMNQVALFDDDSKNIQIAKKKGVNTFYCDATHAKDESKISGFHRDIWVEFVASKGKSKSGGGCNLM